MNRKQKSRKKRRLKFLLKLFSILVSSIIISILLKVWFVLFFILLGALSNALVICLNDFKMPVRSIFKKKSRSSDKHFYYEEKKEVKLWFLGDIFHLVFFNDTYARGFSFSIGDVFLVLANIVAWGRILL